MAMYKFTQAIVQGKAIDVYNHGQMQRDFTYIDDIVTAIVQVMDHIPQTRPAEEVLEPSPATSHAPYRVFNIGNHKPESLLYFIEVLERALGLKAQKNLLPMQMGDVPSTYADIDDLTTAVGFQPTTSIEEGVERFVAWYREYHRVS